MQAVLLSAGKSSRLYPFGQSDHKSMVRLLGKPLIQHTIEGLKENGIKDIVIVVNNNSIEDYFGSGEKFGVSIKYVYQNNPKGMGDAILLAKEELEDNFLLLHGYHLDIGDLGKELLDLIKNSNAGLIAKEKSDTWKYGVLEVKGNKVFDIVEKPKNGEEKSKLCIIGIYYLTKDFINTLQKTPSEEYQFEKALSNYAKEKNVYFVETKKETVFLKYPWDLLFIKDYLLSKIKTSISSSSEIAKSAEITGEVIIEDNVKIMEGAKIKGPAFIGKGAYIGTNAIIRNGVDIEINSVVGANMEIKNSILMGKSTTHSGFIGDSVIGENCKIAAGVTTGNVRLDRKNIKIVVKGEEVDSELNSLGMIVGNNCNFGIKISTMPGVIIGNNVVVGPETIVKNNIQDNTTYYTKFQEVVTKNEEK